MTLTRSIIKFITYLFLALTFIFIYSNKQPAKAEFQTDFISPAKNAYIENSFPSALVPGKQNLVTISCLNVSESTLGTEFKVICSSKPPGWQVTDTGSANKYPIGQNKRAGFTFLVTPINKTSDILKKNLEWQLFSVDSKGNEKILDQFSRSVTVFKPQGKKHIIIDTDPAMGLYTVNDIDDGLAMIYALQQDVDIAGVTVTWGNLKARNDPIWAPLLGIPDMPDSKNTRTIPDLDLALRNADEIKAKMRGDYDVKPGSPLLFDINAKPNDEASRYLLDKVSSEPGEYTIIALANLTNIANAIKLAEETNKQFVYNIRELYIVAGNFSPFLPWPFNEEWNIKFDPEAASYVLKKAHRVCMVPYEATTQWAFTDKEYPNISSISNCITDIVRKPISDWLSTKVSKFIADEIIASKFIAAIINLQHPGQLPNRAFFPFDSVGIAVSLDNDLITSKKYHPVSVYTNLTYELENSPPSYAPKRLEYDGRPACTIVYDYKIQGSGGFRERFLDALTNPKPCEQKSEGSGLALIIDRTGSMTDNDPQNTRIFGGELVLDQAEKNWEIGIACFNTTSALLASGPPQNPSLRDSLKLIGSEGNTNIQAGLEEGYSFLEGINKGKKGAILLTDGEHNWPPDSRFDFQKYVDIFVQKGWPVYTIGLTGSANAVLLSEIASRTGGIYLKADSYQNMVGHIDLILSWFKWESLISLRKDRIRQGEAKTFPFDIDKSVRNANYTGTYGGSKIDFSLIDPYGNEIKATDASRGIEVIEGEVYEIIKINNPVPGTWKAKVVGVDIGAGEEPFEIKISADTPLRIELKESKPIYRLYEPIKFRVDLPASIDKDSLSCSAEIVPPEGQPEKLSLGRQLTIEYLKTGKAGVYYANVSVTGRKNDGEPFMREVLKHFVVSSDDSGAGEIVKAWGGYIEINLGKELGLKPGKNILVYSLAKGTKQKIAEGHIISVELGKSVVELTSSWGAEIPKVGNRVEVEKSEH